MKRYSHLVITILFIIPNITNALDVGFQKVNVPLQGTDNKFPMAVLYPTSSETKSTTFGPFKMNVATGGEVSDGKFPLVILSHGSGGSNLLYKDIAFSLVNNGFIVGMPLHPQNNFLDNSLEGSILNYINRPKHISLSIDKLLSIPDFNAHIDHNKIAVLGHSVGGYTALAAAGGIVNTENMIKLCKNNPSLSDPYCKPVHTNQIIKKITFSSKDSRIKALVLMAPVGALFISKDSLKNVDIPILLLRSEKDEELTEPYNSEAIAKNIHSINQLTYKTVLGAGHYSFLSSYPKSLQLELGAVAHDPDNFNRAEFQKQLGIDISNYLHKVLH